MYKTWHKYLAEDLELLVLDYPGAGSMRGIEPYADTPDLEWSIAAALEDPRFVVYCSKPNCMQGLAFLMHLSCFMGSVSRELLAPCSFQNSCLVNSIVNLMF